MPRYLLDTNILSDAIRNPAGLVAKRIRRFTRSERRDLCTSIIVAAELRFGAAKKNSTNLLERVEAALQSLTVLPLEEDADRQYPLLRCRLEQAGTPVSGNDMLIAAHALSAGCVLVTDNEPEFRRIRGLSVQNWLRPPR